MKKLTFCLLATFFMLSVIPTQIKAATESNLSETTDKSSNLSSESNTVRLNEIKTIDMTELNSSEKDATLKESSPLKDDQDEHGRRYRNRHQQRDVDVTITSGHQMRGDGYYEGRHTHSGAYIGVGGVLVLILILILVL